MIGPLGWLFALCAVALAVWLYRTQDREAALLKINKGLRARIVALQRETREAGGQALALGYRVQESHKEGDVTVIDRAELTEVSVVGGQGKPISDGPYVLATKYADGDPGDQWAVGFYAGALGDRHLVKDVHGRLFRANGFRRVKEISEARGRWILERTDLIEAGARSVWWWARQPMTEKGDLSGKAT